VFGALGVVVGDHMQQVEHCRHLGNAANLADRSSWIDKTQRVQFGPELWNHSLMRRRAQTEVVIDMIGDELREKLGVQGERKRRRAVAAVADGNDEKVQAARRALFTDPNNETLLPAIRRKYGIRESPDLFEGLNFDSHLQCFRDPQHILEFGIKRTILTLVFKAMTLEAHSVASIRLTHFPWPRNFGRITFDLSKSVNTRYSMDFMRKMLLVAVCTLHDLVSAEHYRVLCQLQEVHNALYCTHAHTSDTLRKCQTAVLALVDLVSRTFGADAVNKPNWHNLIVLVFKDLRIVNNILLLQTGPWEAKHQG
jgi:hypothetical protein